MTNSATFTTTRINESVFFQITIENNLENQQKLIKALSGNEWEHVKSTHETIKVTINESKKTALSIYTEFIKNI